MHYLDAMIYGMTREEKSAAELLDAVLAEISGKWYL
jgi:hypothetical protein